MNPLKNLPFKFKPVKQNFQKGHDGVRFIIVHDTANKSRGANASAHFNYFNNGYRGASADYFVDSTQIIQTVSDYNTSWHCGDNQGHGRALNGAKNRNSIGVEICVNSDGNYELAVANTLELVKNLQKIHGVPNSRVQRHYDVSRKRCPGTMFSNNWARWSKFKRDLSKPMILKIDTRANSIAQTVSGSTSTGGGSTSTPSKPSTSTDAWYGDKSSHNTVSGVKQLQSDLVKLGYSVGSHGANGIWGKDTKDAVIRFQTANKSLSIDGNAGQSTLALIKQLLNDGLRVGSKGSKVKQLQEDLIKLGYDVGGVGANGAFGELTKKAVEKFQSTQKNLKRDGIADVVTLARIELELSKAPKSELYRVRENWVNDKTQKGAFTDLDGAVETAKLNKGYNVYDESGKQVYPKATVPTPPSKPAVGELYRVRKSWANTNTQKGAFAEMAGAVEVAKKNKGYKVYDARGAIVYPMKEDKPKEPVKPKPVKPKPEIKPEPKPEPVPVVGVKIEGKPVATAQQMTQWLLKKNKNPEIEMTALELAKLFIEEGKVEGIRGDIAFAQSMKETGWLSYGGQVLPEQNNYAGIGATNNSPTGKGAWFDTERIGVRAQIQHLKAYASREPLKGENVDPRFHLVTRGSAPTWEDLGGRWAVPGDGYGESILEMYEDLIKTKVDDTVEETDKNEPTRLDELERKLIQLKEEFKLQTGKLGEIQKILNR